MNYFFEQRHCYDADGAVADAVAAVDFVLEQTSSLLFVVAVVVADIVESYDYLN